ncbi:cell division protein ZapE [Pseudomonadota bacterium]
MTPLESYRLKLEQSDFVNDPAQEQAIGILQNVYDELTREEAPPPGIFSRLLGRKPEPRRVRGLYLWGGVGRGKTLVVDEFFDCLPFPEKKRSHFHRFMNSVHGRLKEMRHLQDPLVEVAKVFSRDFRVLCFDEFIVNDIADAMILAGLLKNLFQNGVTLVTTSNIHPDRLYRDGLQRDRFLPAIELIKSHTTVQEMTGETDYRLQYLTRAKIYFHPHDKKALSGLSENFRHISPDASVPGYVLNIDDRDLQTVRHADGIVWFTFEEICGGPRSQSDYIELARCYNTIVVSEIPGLPAEYDDKARRLINLIDIMYDRNVKFMGSGSRPPEELYQGTRLRDEFGRTVSRLMEMQSDEYMAKEHLS